MTESIDTMATFPRKHLFEMPNDVIYLDGNSLGPLPKNVLSRVNEVITKEWGERLIRGWNDSKWMEQPLRVGNQIGKLIGALENTVIMGDTLSIKVYQALSAALELNPQRRVILSDSGNFPTDLYMAQGLIQSLNNGYELHIVEPEDVITAIDETVAAVMITHVDYRTGRMHNMQRITQKAHKNGAVLIAPERYPWIYRHLTVIWLLVVLINISMVVLDHQLLSTCVLILLKSCAQRSLGGWGMIRLLPLLRHINLQNRLNGCAWVHHL
jgi:selenocysteine lyase/cysteine desulfurase